MHQLCGLLTAVFWLGGGYYFIVGATDWTVTPAEARNNNKVSLGCLWGGFFFLKKPSFSKDCIIADFFDPHDVWHALSAYGTWRVA